MKYAAKTDIGRRAQNEDAFLIPDSAEALPLFAVSDGMGGALAGEVASRMVTEGLKEEFSTNGKLVSERTLRGAIRGINISVYRLAQADVTKHGMGATLVCAYIGPEKVLAANVGDSRLYRICGGEIRQITKDQSYVQRLIDIGAITPEEAKTHSKRGQILQAVGAEIGIRPDFYTFERVPGDRLLLCSDGLSGALSDGELLAVCNACPDPADCADALIRAALAAHASDNITALVIDLEEEVRP